MSTANSSQGNRNISFQNNTDTLPHLISLLEEGQTLSVQPTGTSMSPFFLGNRDTLFIGKPTFPLKKGEIALYKRHTGAYYVHRVYRVLPTESSFSYFMLGDNQTWIEGPIPQEQVYGVVKSYLRKGKKIDCTSNQMYNLLWKIWMFLRPVRPVLNRLILLRSKWKDHETISE